jgi:hypothetical protein
MTCLKASSGRTRSSRQWRPSTQGTSRRCRTGAATLQDQLDSTLPLVCWSGVAASYGLQLELIDVLIDAGAALAHNANNALVNGHIAAAEHLLARGAPLTLAAALCLERWEEVPWLAAAATPAQRQFALVLAALNGKAAGVHWLLEHGALVNEPSADLYAHGTPLHHDVCSGSDPEASRAVEHRHLSQFLAGRMERSGIGCQTVRLVDHHISAGTYSDMGDGDEWSAILRQLLDSQIIIFATPVWWGGHSSLIQRAIERLDELHDRLLAGESSPLEGKVGGIVITGDSDGAQHILGNLCNFYHAIGLLIPPYATLSVLWERQSKGSSPTRDELLRKYEADYGSTADKMIGQLLAFPRP